ncbi:MAG: transposase [Candidatus Freyarchaeum deiterrae]
MLETIMVTTATRTEQIHLQPNSRNSINNKNLSRLCHYSKNLYNQANYIVRQNLLQTGKWTRYEELAGALKNAENYKALPAQTAQQTLKTLDRSWKSFFRATQEWKKNPDKFLGRPKMPGYKEKNGEHLLIFTNQQCRIMRDGEIKFPKKVDLKVKTRLEDETRLREIRIVPEGGGYVLEVVYHRRRRAVEKEPRKLPRGRVMGVDLGLRNTVTIVNNIGEKPIAVKGGVLKSINQYYNREKARLQSVYDCQGLKTTGSKLLKLTGKRNRKIHDFFHKLSRGIVEWCVRNDIGTIVVGYNDNGSGGGWKQSPCLGRRNNQNFVQIPFQRLLQQVCYKAEEAGITVVVREESYTSKCSFLDNEPLGHCDEYAGRRISRGLFRSNKGVVINADVNAAYNIIRKAFPEAFTADGIEGVGLHPVRMNLNAF